jgi:hypothetical protein
VKLLSLDNCLKIAFVIFDSFSNIRLFSTEDVDDIFDVKFRNEKLFCRRQFSQRPSSFPRRLFRRNCNNVSFVRSFVRSSVWNVLTWGPSLCDLDVSATKKFTTSFTSLKIWQKFSGKKLGYTLLSWYTLVYLRREGKSNKDNI